MKQTKPKPIQKYKQKSNPLKSFVKKIATNKLSLFLIMIILLSVVDAFFTLYWIRKGWADEANPLLSEFLYYGDRWFLAIKFSLTYFGCVILYLTKKQLFASLAIKIILSMYVFLTVYHLFGALVSIDCSAEWFQCVFAEFRTIFLSF